MKKLAVILALTAAVHAQQTNPKSSTIPCTTNKTVITGAPLQTVPEIRRDAAAGVLRGTLYSVSEQVMMTATTAGPGTGPQCFPQWVRAYRPDPPSTWNPPPTQLLNPMPGPTLRARLGDLVELTFLNSIDAAKFPNADTGCEQTGPGGSVYPKGANDTYPDCFAGSVFTNVHYHGTHTNPNTTGDNVFINVRPSPRRHDGTNAPVVTAASVQPQFDEFFRACEQQLKADPGPRIWPRLWRDIPEPLQKTLMDLVKEYGVKGWYEANQNLIANGNWPQYFVGAVPYCFKLPEYGAPAPTTTTSADARTPHTHGAGTAEVDEAKAPTRPLLMGQSPGTHWYHAHKHGSTTINVMNGMTGVFVIEGPYDDAIRKFYASASPAFKEWVLVVQQLGTQPGLAIGKPQGPGPDFSVNGQLRPTISMRGNEVQLWRIANTSGRAGTYFLSPPANTLQWKQLAQDGVQFTPANYAGNINDEFLLASGNRADLLVKAPPYVKGGNNTYTVQVYNTVDRSDRPPQSPGAGALTLLNVSVTPNGADMQFIPGDQAPAFPSFLSDITDDEITGTKVITFASTQPPGAQHTIDNKKFDGELGVVVELNRAEEWKIQNKTYGPSNLNPISHPFHIHINPFQVTEVFDPNTPLEKSVPGSGTVTTTAKSNTITGTGTQFLTEVRIGDSLWINGATPAIVQSIQSDTSLTADTQPGAAGPVTNAAYSISVPLYTVDKANARAGQCVLDPRNPSTWKPCTRTEPATERIWWDVFSMPSGRIFPASGDVTTTTAVPGYFKMRSRFVDYAGYYVIHCHILAHEDRGMMTVVEVTPVQTPYSHH